MRPPSQPAPRTPGRRGTRPSHAPAHSGQAPLQLALTRARRKSTIPPNALTSRYANAWPVSASAGGGGAGGAGAPVMFCVWDVNARPAGGNVEGGGYTARASVGARAPAGDRKSRARRVFSPPKEKKKRVRTLPLSLARSLSAHSLAAGSPPSTPDPAALGVPPLSQFRTYRTF